MRSKEDMDRSRYAQLMVTVEKETWKDKIRNNGQENVNSFPLGGMATAALMDPYLSPAEEQPTKNCLSHHILCDATTK